MIKIVIISSLLLTLSGCATYKSSFNCGDARGAYCASMDHVDEMINSGEIERFNEQRLKQKYTKNNNVLPLRQKTNPVKIINYGVTSYGVDDADH